MKFKLAYDKPYVGVSVLSWHTFDTFLAVLHLALGNQRISVWVSLLATCGGELSTIIAWQMPKCGSGGEELRR